jgi:hypothetical protein
VEIVTQNGQKMILVDRSVVRWLLVILKTIFFLDSQKKKQDAFMHLANDYYES